MVTNWFLKAHECSTFTYVSLNDWNVPNVLWPHINAPFFYSALILLLKFCQTNWVYTILVLKCNCRTYNDNFGQDITFIGTIASFSKKNLSRGLAGGAFNIHQQISVFIFNSFATCLDQNQSYLSLFGFMNAKWQVWWTNSRVSWVTNSCRKLIFGLSPTLSSIKWNVPLSQNGA